MPSHRAAELHMVGAAVRRTGYERSSSAGSCSCSGLVLTGSSQLASSPSTSPHLSAVWASMVRWVSASRAAR